MLIHLRKSTVFALLGIASSSIFGHCPEHLNGITVTYMQGQHIDNISLPDSVKKSTYDHTVYGQLSKKYNNTLFKKTNLQNPPLMRQLITGKQTSELDEKHLNSGQQKVVTTPNGIDVHYTFFDRNSDKLLVVGGGFTDTRDRMAPFLAMFPKYDIVLFDYRGHGLDNKPKGLIAKATKKQFKVDSTITKFSEEEEDEVLTIVKTMKSKKKYTQIYGVGLCYSAALFTKTEAINPGTFNKLLLEGAWPKLTNLTDIYINNPIQAITHKRNNGIIHQVLKRFHPLQWLIIKGWELLFNRNFKMGLDTEYYFEQLTIPVMFFHSLNDYLIPTSEFQKVFNAVGKNNNNQKLALLTPTKHVSNFLKYKELFAYAGNHFFENDFESTRKMLTNQ